jgi:hypothetical protein
MKKLLATFLTLSTVYVFSQTHAGINYQSIIRNTGGTVMASTPVTIDFKLYSTVPTFSNTLLYHETHATTTNQFGMANVVIGKGTMLGGVFSFTNVPWPAGVAYEVFVNSNIVGSRQPFMSVPYAFAAAYAPAPSVTYSNNILSVGGNTVGITSGTTYTAGPGIAIFGTGISNIAPDQTVTINAAGAATVTGTYPNFTVNAPSGTNLPTGFNGQFLYNTGGTVWDTLPRNNLYFDGTNFGIGTTNPQANFHVNGDGKFNSSVTTPHLFTNTITISGGTTGQILTSDATGNGTWQTPGATASYSLTSNSNTLTLSNGSAITTATVPVQPSVTGSGVANVTPAGSNYLVNVPMSSYNNTTGVFTTGTQTISVVPTLFLTGNVLKSGPASNSVTIPAATVVSGNPNIIVTPSGNTFSVSAVPQTLSIASNSVITLTNGGSVNITPAVLSYTSATNVLKLTHGSSSNTFTLNTNNQTLSTSGNSLTISGAGGNTILLPTPAAPWMQGVGTVTLTNFSDLVGIGTNSPASPLHITNSGGAQLRLGNINQPTYEWIWNVDATSNLSLVNEGNGTPATRMNIDVNTGYTGLGIGNTSASSMLEIGTDGSLDKGLRISNTGSTVGPSIYFKAQSKDWTITASNPASGAGANKLVFRDYSLGLDRMVIDASGNVGIGTTSPSSRLNVVSSGVPPTITGTNNGSGHGIFGETNSSASAGLMGVNGNSGPSVAGTKVSPATGNVASFKNTNTTNNADALLSQTDGGGAAVHTINGSSSITTSNLGILIDDGHLGTTASVNLTASTPNTCGCVSSVTMDSHSTDVAGTLRAVFTSTTSALVDVNVTFAKPYKKYPVVIVTAGTHPPFSNTQYIVTPIGSTGNYTGFKLSIEGGINSSSAPFLYNYMVIEGKN